jgi:uncharacterized protein with PIN domain
MAGFDTLWDNAWDDDAIVSVSLVQKRTILTRDKGMLRRSEVERGYFVRATRTEAQLHEVVHALQLEPLLAPFTRCPECNAPGCGRVYWEGTHYSRMKGVIERLQGP